MTAHRLSTGGRINRGRAVRFTWDGRMLQGYQGDTLASTLIASGEQVIGRSFKYHRPRGVMSAGVEESGAIVSIGAGAKRIPNVKATTQEICEGMTAHAQNAWPDLRFDLGEVNNLISQFLSAGFYYKTFFGPARSTGMWMFFEKFIRRAAGMGAASRNFDPDSYDIVHGFCDLLVVGAGPAGLSAALEAAEAGLDVVIVEQDFELGGSLLSADDQIEGEDAEAWRAARIAALNAAGARLMPRTTAFGLYDGGAAGLLERVSDHLASPSPHLPRERFHILRARRTVLATGAIERTIAFGGNDRPGVMLAGAARTYVNRFAVLPGTRAVIAATHDGAYEAALTLAGAGARATVLDARPIAPAALAESAAEAGIEVLAGYAPVQTQGRMGVSGVQIGRLGDGSVAIAERMVECDLLAVAGGWSPVVNLLSHRGVKPVWDEGLTAFLPGETDLPIEVCGAASGIWRTDDCIRSGLCAGAGAVRALTGERSKTPQAPKIPQAPAPGGWETPIRPLYEVRVANRKLKSFVDPQHDVTTEDVRLAHREGFVSVEHMKRYTTLGMATDQGKVGNVIGLALMAEARGASIPQTGVTTFRPPYTPVSIGALAGRARRAHWRPVRLTPMHAAHLRDGAVMTDAGAWKRSWYYPRAGETINEAYVREAAEVRRSVGMVDVSSLGKIAVQGPDAAEFLNRIYVNAFAKLHVGRARYGLMLRDDGVVLDDGTTWRMAENDYFMTTTTAQAGPVMAWCERLLQTRWPELKVHVSSVTEQWAGTAVAGPQCRKVLAVLITDVDWTDAAFPFMGVREGRIAVAGGSVPCRIARISFSGERAYEVYVESDYGAAAWDALKAQVESLGGCPYGLEALGALRIEKGHVTGAELDGRTTLEDAGFARMASTKKPYIGAVLRQRPELRNPDRPSLCGVFPIEDGETWSVGGILCAEGDTTGHGAGWVTAAAHSPALGHWIGLGFIAGGPEAWAGKTAMVHDPVRNRSARVRIVSPHMYDPDGSRMHD